MKKIILLLSLIVVCFHTRAQTTSSYDDVKFITKQYPGSNISYKVPTDLVDSYAIDTAGMITMSDGSLSVILVRIKNTTTTLEDLGTIFFSSYADKEATVNYKTFTTVNGLDVYDISSNFVEDSDKMVLFDRFVKIGDDDHFVLSIEYSGEGDDVSLNKYYTEKIAASLTTF